MKKCFREFYVQESIIVLLLATVLSATGRDVMPMFLKEPKLSRISADSEGTIFCQVAPQDATVDWLFNDEPLKPHEHSGLEFRGTNLHFDRFKYSSNEGIYHCVASSEAGSIISQPLILTKPVLKEFPPQSDVNIVAPLGGSAVIPCPTASWTQDTNIYVQTSSGKLLNITTDAYLRLPSGSVIIRSVKETDADQYRCIATNQQRTVTSSHVINLTVKSKGTRPLTEIVLPGEEKILPLVGDTVVLECPTVSTGLPDVKWMKYGGTLSKERTKVEYGNLYIEKVKIEDAGTYICHGTSDRNQKLIAIEVQEPVKAEADSRVISANVGEEVELHCTVIGHPEPYVTWYHDSKQIGHTSGRNTGGAVFVINKVTPSHAGFYQCLASNSLTSASSKMRLEVKGQGLSPRGQNDETTISILDGEKGSNNETTYQGVAKTENKPKKKKHDGRRVKKNKRRKKKKKKKKNKKKKRKKDRHRKEKRPNVPAKLVPPSRPHVEQLSDTSVKLNWTVPQNDGLKITFFRVQYKEVSPNEAHWHTDDKDIDRVLTVCEVKGLRPGGIYKFRIAAVYSNNDNEVGLNSHRFFMNVAPHGKAAPPVEKPTIVEATTLQVNEVGKEEFGIGIKWQYMLSEASPIEGFFILYKPYNSKEQWKKVTILETKVRSHVLGYLQPDTEYSIRMQCFNSAGNSEYSNTVVKRTMGPERNDDPRLHPFHPKIATPTPRPVKVTPVKTAPPIDDEDDVEEVNHEPTDTQTSSELMFMVLGIVLGVMLLILIFCMGMCWWKQRHQHHMLAMNGVIHSKYQDQAQRIYGDAMKKKYMNGYPLSGFNGIVANGHGPHGNGIPGNKMNINVNPMTPVDTQLPHNHVGKNSTGIPNGSVVQHRTSDNNFNSINTAQSLDEIPSAEPLLSESERIRNMETVPPDPAVLQRLGHGGPQDEGQSSNEADMSSGDTNSCVSPRVKPGFDYFSTSSERHVFEGGTSTPVFCARSAKDSLSPGDNNSGSHGKHKRRRKRPHSREHTTKDQATNTDLSSNEGTIEFTTFNKSPSSDKMQTFTGSGASQNAKYSNGDV